VPSRVIRGEILTSESMSRVSRDAEMLFWRLILYADDFGRLDCRIRVLKGALYTLRDDVGPEQIIGWLRELHTEGCIQVYQVGGHEYAQLTNWEEHRGNQRRGAQSRLPGPTESDPPPSPDSRGIPGNPPLVGGGGGVGGGVGDARTSGESREPDDPLEGYDPQKLVSLIGEENLPWLTDELPSIVAAARAALAEKGVETPTRKQMTAKVKDRLLAFWKWRQGKGATHHLSPAQAREERSRQAALKVVRELEGAE